MGTEVRRELWEVTEYRDGARYNSKSLGMVWIPQGLSRELEASLAEEMGGDFFTSISTSSDEPRMRNLRGDGTYSYIY